MKNLKKVFILLTVVFVSAFFAFAQEEPAKNADIVIMLDTSGGILQYYEEVNNQVLAKISSGFIRKGDTVHILSFNSSAHYEISQKINTEKDLSRVVSRFLLMYQIAQNSDFLTGLNFCKNYTARLPKNEEQILIVISDGIFNPPAESPYRNFTDQQVKNEISRLAGDIRKSGWKVYYVKLPYPADAIIRNLESEEFYAGTDGSLKKRDGSKDGLGSEKDGSDGYLDVSGSFTESSGAAKSDFSKDKEFEINKNIKNFPIITYPDSIEATGKNLKFSVNISNGTDETAKLKLEKIILDTGSNPEEIRVDSKEIVINSGEETVLEINAKLPPTYQTGKTRVLLGLEFADGKKVFPQFAELYLLVFPTTMQKLLGSNIFYIIIAVLVLLILIILIASLIKNRTANPVSKALGREDARSSGFGLQNEEEKRQPKKLNEDDDHKKRLQEFSAGASASAKSNKDNSSKNLSKIAEQIKADEALKANILRNSVIAQQPRGVHMSPANFMEKIEIKANRSGMSEIFVLNQNRRIGKRNIHVMKAGTRLSVGGGKNDDFCVFLVPFPSKLAQVRYDGKDYHLAILKPEYFPYEKSNIVNNCIGKTITLVSDKGYHVYFTFRDYEDPITKLNSILNSIK